MGGACDRLCRARVCGRIVASQCCPAEKLPVIGFHLSGCAPLEMAR
jgi:hypothetical protein